MYHLLTALADDAEVILVGDPDQLAVLMPEQF